MLPRIRDLLQGDDAPRKIIIAAVPDRLVEPLEQVSAEILGDLDEPENGIYIVLPIARIAGLREQATPP
jgi:hypothetical protein